MGQVNLTYGFEDFVPEVEPLNFRLVSETYTNERNRIRARQTDHASLQPLPAPGARVAQHTFAFTERPFGVAFDPTVTGERNTPVSPHVKPSPLQQMNPHQVYHVNTLRMEAEPWDTDLIG